MKILAIEKELPSATAERYKPHLQAEAAQVWKLYQADVIREMYFDRDKHNAVLILEGQDVADANRALGTLPLVKAGLIAFDVIPLTPYTGFARLIPAE